MSHGEVVSVSQNRSHVSNILASTVNYTDPTYFHRYNTRAIKRWEKRGSVTLVQTEKMRLIRHIIIVFAMRLVDLRFVTCYADQNFKIKCSFRSSTPLHLEKGLKKVVLTKSIPESYLKILSQCTVKKRRFAEEKRSDSFAIQTYLHLIILKSFFAICRSLFFSKTNERKMEATLSQTQCPVFKRLQRHICKRTLTVLLGFTK